LLMPGFFDNCDKMGYSRADLGNNCAIVLSGGQ